MPYYLTPYVGSGNRLAGDPFRPRGSDQPGWAAVDLRPNGGATLDGGGLNACLLYLPIPTADPQLRLIGDTADEVTAGPTKVALRSILGLSGLPVGVTLRDILFDLLRSPPINGWRALQPGPDGMRRLHLGPLQFQQVAMESPAFPLAVAALARIEKISRRAALAGLLAGSLVWSWPRRAWAALIADTFDRADGDLDGSTSSDGSFVWQEYGGTGWQVLSNQAQETGLLNTFVQARAQIDLSGDMYAQAILSILTRVLGDAVLELVIRLDASAGDPDYYAGTAGFQFTNGNQHAIYKQVSGVSTTLVADTGTVGEVGEVLRAAAIGSSISAQKNGVHISGSPVTDTALTNVRKRTGMNAFLGNASNTIGANNFEAADVAGVGVGPLGIAPLRSILGVGI